MVTITRAQQLENAEHTGVLLGAALSKGEVAALLDGLSTKDEETVMDWIQKNCIVEGPSTEDTTITWK